MFIKVYFDNDSNKTWVDEIQIDGKTEFKAKDSDFEITWNEDEGFIINGFEGFPLLEEMFDFFCRAGEQYGAIESKKLLEGGTWYGNNENI